MKKFGSKALATSLFAIVVCFVMLLGTTYAWFTDSVISGNNIIASGQLNVNAYWMDGDLDPTANTWNEFDGTAIYDNALWEPGYVEVKHFKVSNEGALAFKYKLVIAPNGTVSELADVIDVYYFNEATQMARDTLSNATYVGTLAEVIANQSNGATNGVLLPVGATAKNANEFTGFVTGTMVFKMRETAGNEYQGLSIGTSFDIRVMASQYTFEDDSFGSDYDNNAEYFNIVNNVADLTELLEAGKNVMLACDLEDVPVATPAPYGNKLGLVQNGGILDGNGYAIDFDMPSGDHYGIMTSGGTIKNLTVGGVFRGIVIMSPTEDVVIDNCVVGDEDVCYSINTAEGNGQHNVIVKNTTIYGWNSYGNTIKSVTFENCKFEQGTYYTNVYGRLVRPYVNTTFTNCEFVSTYYVDLSALIADNTVTFDGCKVNGIALTASNWASMVVSESDCGAGQISIEGRNGSFMSSTNVFDYVTIK